MKWRGRVVRTKRIRRGLYSFFIELPNGDSVNIERLAESLIRLQEITSVTVDEKDDGLLIRTRLGEDRGDSYGRLLSTIKSAL
jgi:hypothetical protein